jgi:hypothetical protein
MGLTLDNCVGGIIFAIRQQKVHNMQIFITLPGMKKESLIIPDNATIAQFTREAFHKTGSKVFNGLGYVSGDGAAYLVSAVSRASLNTPFDSTTQLNFANFLIAPPAAPVPQTATSGGTIAANTYFVVVTYVNPTGETLASAQASITTTGAASTITIPSPAAVADASQYKVYMGTTNGSLWKLQGVATNIGTNFLQTTTPAGATNVPVSNTASSPVLPGTPFTSCGVANGDELIYTQVLNDNF